MGKYTNVSYCPRCGNTAFSEEEMICSYCGENRFETDINICEFKKWPRYKVIRWEEDLLDYALKPSPKFNAEDYEASKKWVANKVEIRENTNKDISRNTNESTYVRCPSCGSTQIQLVSRKWSFLTGFFTNKVDRVCVNCKRRF